jgi:hypothetical protein
MQFLRLQSLLSLLLKLVFMIGFGLLGNLGMTWYFQSVTDRYLAKWTPLGTPLGKAVSVQSIASQSILEKTIVKTGDGKFSAYQPGSSSNWVETYFPYPERTNLNVTCPGPDFGRPRPSLPHAIVDCYGVFTWEWSTTEDYFAVLDDGSVWRWQYGISFGEGVNRSLLVLIATTLGTLSGFFLSEPVRNLVPKNIK